MRKKRINSSSFVLDGGVMLDGKEDAAERATRLPRGWSCGVEEEGRESEEEGTCVEATTQVEFETFLEVVRQRWIDFDNPSQF